MANGKAPRGWRGNLPDPVPVHREPIYTARPELVAKYPTRPDGRQFRMANLGFSIQKAAVDKGLAKQFPIILTSGRLVEYEGGGEENAVEPLACRIAAGHVSSRSTPRTRANAASRMAAGSGCSVLKNGSKTRVKALVTDRVGKGRGVHAVPLRRLVPGVSISATNIQRATIRSCSAKA